jgi:hypothetical protein
LQCAADQTFILCCKTSFGRPREIEPVTAVKNALLFIEPHLVFNSPSMTEYCNPTHFDTAQEHSERAGKASTQSNKRKGADSSRGCTVYLSSRYNDWHAACILHLGPLTTCTPLHQSALSPPMFRAFTLPHRRTEHGQAWS